MNAQFQAWFSHGKAVEALCGTGRFFIADPTYREEHNYVLAVGELLQWAREGHYEDAAKALETALLTLLDERFEHALLLCALTL